MKKLQNLGRTLSKVEQRKIMGGYDPGGCEAEAVKCAKRSCSSESDCTTASGNCACGTAGKCYVKTGTC
jgi:hypothetical protein